jgi:hypothetical protein
MADSLLDAARQQKLERLAGRSGSGFYVCVVEFLECNPSQAGAIRQVVEELERDCPVRS